jgi:hypothetical protein
MVNVSCASLSQNVLNDRGGIAAAVAVMERNDLERTVPLILAEVVSPDKMAGAVMIAIEVSEMGLERRAEDRSSLGAGANRSGYE